LDVARVRAALGGSRFRDVRYEAVTGSTNDDATALLASSDAAGATLVAEQQTAGRGRKAGRSWIAPPGSGLLFTTILPVPIATADLWAVPFWAALAVADGIAQACGVRIDLRWPNDGFLANRKVLGILCVSRVAGERAFVGCGIGINVRRPVDDTPSAIVPPPAFLDDVAAAPLREEVLTRVLLAFERRLRALEAPAAIARDYEERAGLAGAPYRVRLDAENETFEGVARGLGPDGTLRLAVGGTERLISLADAQRL
jgi:BirA family biotin operon repressor/biotin-[acetyl-CoA-carboxylase] ligase